MEPEMEDSSQEPVEDLIQQLRSPSPLPALRALRRRLPEVRDQVRAVVQILGRLLEDERADVAEAAEELLQEAFKEEKPEEHRGGQRHFEWLGVHVDYWELDDDQASDLLFGYALWPCGGQLARMLITASKPEQAEGDACRTAEALCSIIPSAYDARVLELGAGVGLPGLSCHACGASRVLLTDGEERLVEAMREHHGHLRGVSCELWNWELEAATDDFTAAEEFDLILGSDIMLSTNRGHVCVPKLVGRHLRRIASARALIISGVRKAETHLVAVAEFEKQGFCVKAFRVSDSLSLTELAVEGIRKLPSDCHVLLVVGWEPACCVAEASVISPRSNNRTPVAA